MDRKIKVAVVGAGNWGYQHARAFFERKDTELVAIWGRSPERTAARAAQFGVNWYTDLDEMLRKEEPDLVSVCLPAQHTFEVTMHLIGAGIPMLVEKPLAYKLEEAQALIDAAEKKELFFAINFETRYSIPCQMAKKDIEDGKLGKLVFALWRFGHGWGEKGSWIDHPYTNLIEAQCHGINMLESLCGPIQSVMAEMTNNGGRESYSSFSLSLRFENGAVGSFLATFDADEHNRLSQIIEIGGVDGRILIEDNVQRYTFQANGDPIASVWQAGFFEDDLRSFGKSVDRHLDALIPAFREGRKPPIPAREGLRALKIAYAAIESFQTGKRIMIQ